jgi:hypothetical protein
VGWIHSRQSERTQGWQLSNRAGSRLQPWQRHPEGEKLFLANSHPTQRNERNVWHDDLNDDGTCTGRHCIMCPGDCGHVEFTRSGPGARPGSATGGVGVAGVVGVGVAARGRGDITRHPSFWPSP